MNFKEKAVEIAGLLIIAGGLASMFRTSGSTNTQVAPMITPPNNPPTGGITITSLQNQLTQITAVIDSLQATLNSLLAIPSFAQTPALQAQIANLQSQIGQQTNTKISLQNQLYTLSHSHFASLAPTPQISLTGQPVTIANDPMTGTFTVSDLGGQNIFKSGLPSKSAAENYINQNLPSGNYSISQAASSQNLLASLVENYSNTVVAANPGTPNQGTTSETINGQLYIVISVSPTTGKPIAWLNTTTGVIYQNTPPPGWV